MMIHVCFILFSAQELDLVRINYELPSKRLDDHARTFMNFPHVNIFDMQNALLDAFLMSSFCLLAS